MTDKTYALTQEEAQTILDTLITNEVSIRNADQRTDVEKLAIGLVCLKYSTGGMTQRKIGETLGIPQATVHRYLHRAYQSVALPTVSQARQHALDVIDRQLEVWIPKSEAGDEKAANVVQKFLSERNRITGALSPIQVDQTVTEISPAERELHQLLEQQERDNKLQAAKVDA